MSGLTDEQVAEGLKLARELGCDWVAFEHMSDAGKVRLTALALKDNHRLGEVIPNLFESYRARCEAAEADRDRLENARALAHTSLAKALAERDEAREAADRSEKMRAALEESWVENGLKARREAFEEAAKLKCEMCACVGAQEDGSGTIEAERAGRHLLVFAGTGSRSSFKCQAADIRALAEVER
jgi:hypothetical protein